MFNLDEIMTIESIMREAFPNIDEVERNKMVENLITYYPEAKSFCVMNGNHIARVGVRYTIGSIVKGCFYYSTEYDNELLDL